MTSACGDPVKRRIDDAHSVSALRFVSLAALSSKVTHERDRIGNTLHRLVLSSKLDEAGVIADDLLVLALGDFVPPHQKRARDSHCMARRLIGKKLVPVRPCSFIPDPLNFLLRATHQKLARRDEDHGEFDVFAVFVLADDDFLLHRHAEVLRPGLLMPLRLLGIERGDCQWRGVGGPLDDTFLRR